MSECFGMSADLLLIFASHLYAVSIPEFKHNGLPYPSLKVVIAEFKTPNTLSVALTTAVVESDLNPAEEPAQ